MAQTIFHGFPVVVDRLDDLSLTEFGYLDTSLPGVIVPSKCAVVDSAGQLPHKRMVVADAAYASPVQLTADQSGALCVFDETAGSIFLLPGAAAGLYYDFVVAVASSSNGHRVTCAAADFMLGSILMDDGDTGLTTSAAAADGATHLAIFLDAAATGRLAGGFFRLTAISASQWVIQGHLLHTGNVGTPFETT
jgi:hypothetical protein